MRKEKLRNTDRSKKRTGDKRKNGYIQYIQYIAMKLTVHCKKELAIFPSPAGMSLTKLSLGGKKLNYSRPGRV